MAGAGLATPAMAQRLGQAGGTDIAWWRLLGALVLCLVLAVAGALALRARMGAGAPPLPAVGPTGAKVWLRLISALRPISPMRPGKARRLQLVETLRLSHQIDICLIECDGEGVMIAATPHGAIVIERHQSSKATASS